MQLVQGQVVAKNLRLIRLLGEGGMGCVWIAEHTTLGIQVAVKFVLAEHASKGEAAIRFSREAQAAAQIKHPHVVQIFDHGVTEEGLPYIAMELLEGEELSKRISRLGGLSLADALTVLKQTSKALGKAHAMGVIHRDIKPENIFLANVDGEIFVKVLDFGIAKSTVERSHGLTGTNTAMGTAYYMSPEQFMSAKHVDHRADLWALAVAMYQCLTASLPFEGETMPAVFVAIDKGQFRAPSQLRPDLPASIDAWFARALDRDLEKRFSSAKQMVEAFEYAITGAELRSGVSMTAQASTNESAAPQLSTEGPVSVSQERSKKQAQGKTLAMAGAAGLGVLVLAIVLIGIVLKSAPAGEKGLQADSALRPGMSAASIVSVAISGESSAQPAVALEAPKPSSSDVAVEAPEKPSTGAASANKTLTKTNKPTDKSTADKATGKEVPTAAPTGRKAGF
jgi:serine/threonine-protein kinase